MFRKIDLTISLLVLTLGLAGPAQAEILPPPAEGEAFWGLGATGVLCYRDPCPRHGVFPIHRDGTRGLPLSRIDQRQPPPLRADERDRARIEDAFHSGGCVVAEGHFEGEMLVVLRLLGDCREGAPG